MAFIDETWLRGAFEALVETFNVDDTTRKAMIQFLLDEGFWDPKKLGWPAAEARFRSCLNPHKAEFFKVGEVWALMSRFGRHQLFHAMADDLGYELRVIPTEERRQALIERLVITSERLEGELATARAAIERLAINPPATVQRLHPGQKAHFSHGTDAATAVQRVGCP